MTMFIKNKELDAMEELWVRPFKHLPFYYVTPVKADKLYENFNPKKWSIYTVFTDLHEAIMHAIQQLGGNVPHGGGKLHMYTLIHNKPIQKYKMTLIDPADDLAMACELYEPVTFEFSHTIIIEDIVWTKGRVSNIHYRIETSELVHKYSDKKTYGFWEPFDTYDTVKLRESIQQVYNESPLSEALMKGFLKDIDASKVMYTANYQLQTMQCSTDTNPVLQLNILKNRNEKGEN